MERPTIFISYSWDSENHREWVLRLADNLISKYGVNVLLDQYELSAGKDLAYFMENSIEKSNKVLLILTPAYKLKAEDRTGGVGYEYSMISQELFEIQANNNKFIPILRQGNLSESSPKYIKSKVYHEMVNDSDYLRQLFSLSRILYDKPKIVKPELGNTPDFNNVDYDPILELATNLNSEAQLNNELNKIINSPDGIIIVNNEIDKMFNLILNKAKLYSEKTLFNFHTQSEPRSSLVLGCQSYSIRINWKQNYINTLEQSALIITFWFGQAALNSSNPMYFPGKEPKRKKTLEYTFDLTSDKNPVWLLKDKTITSSDEIVKKVFSYILEQIRIEMGKEHRRE